MSVRVRWSCFVKSRKPSDLCLSKIGWSLPTKLRLESKCVNKTPPHPNPQSDEEQSVPVSAVVHLGEKLLYHLAIIYIFRKQLANASHLIHPLLNHEEKLFSFSIILRSLLECSFKICRLTREFSWKPYWFVLIRLIQLILNSPQGRRGRRITTRHRRCPSSRAGQGSSKGQIIRTPINSSHQFFLLFVRSATHI